MIAENFEEKKPRTISKQFQEIKTMEDLRSMTFESGKNAGRSYLDVRDNDASYLLFLFEKQIDWMAKNHAKDEDLGPYPGILLGFSDFAKQGLLKKLEYTKKKFFETISSIEKLNILDSNEGTEYLLYDVYSYDFDTTINAENINGHFWEFIHIWQDLNEESCGSTLEDMFPDLDDEHISYCLQNTFQEIKENVLDFEERSLEIFSLRYNNE